MDRSKEVIDRRLSGQQPEDIASEMRLPLERVRDIIINYFDSIAVIEDGKKKIYLPPCPALDYARLANCRYIREFDA